MIIAHERFSCFAAIEVLLIRRGAVHISIIEDVDHVEADSSILLCSNRLHLAAGGHARSRTDLV